MARGAKKTVQVNSKLKKLDSAKPTAAQDRSGARLAHLIESLKEAAEIRQGTFTAARVTVFDDAKKTGVAVVTGERKIERIIRKQLGGGDDRLDENSTLGRMLVELKKAALEVIDAIEDVRHYGHDDEAVLYVAASVIHQKSESVMRQLDCDDSKPSTAMNRSRAMLASELVASMREAVQIHRGQRKAARVTVLNKATE